MKILNDQLNNESLRKLENHPDPLDRRAVNLLKDTLRLQVDIISRIDVSNMEVSAFQGFIFYFFIKLRSYYRAVIRLIIDKNSISSEAITRIIFEHIVLMYFIAIQKTDDGKNLYAKKLYEKDRRDLFKLICETSGLLKENQPYLKDSSEIEEKIKNLPIEKRNILEKSIEEEISRGKRNPASKQLIDQISDHKLLLFRKNAEYWKTVKKEESKFEIMKNVADMCKHTDKEMAKDTDTWSLKPDWSGCYETLYRITSRDVHASTLGVSRFIDEKFQQVDFNTIHNKVGLVITLIEHVLLSCWLLDKEFGLGMKDKINGYFGRNASWLPHPSVVG
jgi:hypothetical protein